MNQKITDHAEVLKALIEYHKAFTTPHPVIMRAHHVIEEQQRANVELMARLRRDGK